jgi:hypothetical protein
MNIGICQFVRWLPIAVLMLAGSACNLPIATRSAVNPQFIVVTATGDNGESAPLPPSPTLEPTLTQTVALTFTPTFTPTLTVTSTAKPVTMTAGQVLSCVKGPHWVLYEWVTSIAIGETVTLLAKAPPEWQDYYYIRKSDGTECWAFGGSSTKSGDLSTLPVMDAPPLPVVTYTIENKTHLNACDVFIRGKGEAAWGADRLGAGLIAPGTQFSLDLTAGFYDVLIKDCFGGILYSRTGTPIGSDANSHYTLLNLQIKFSILNATVISICRIRAVPSDGSGFIDFRTAADSPMAPGATVWLTETAGAYQLQFARCADDVIIKIISGGYIGSTTTGFTVTLP